MGMNRPHAYRLVRQWTEEELEVTYYTDKGKAEQVAEAYSIVLRKKYVARLVTDGQYLVMPDTTKWRQA
jgi:hypothetical protein